MLRSTRVSGCVLSASNLAVRRRSASRPEAEQRLKGGHWLPTPIVPKYELVQVDLKLRLTDPVVRADQGTTYWRLRRENGPLILPRPVRGSTWS